MAFVLEEQFDDIRPPTELDISRIPDILHAPFEFSGLTGRQSGLGAFDQVRLKEGKAPSARGWLPGVVCTELYGEPFRWFQPGNQHALSGTLINKAKFHILIV